MTWDSHERRSQDEATDLGVPQRSEPATQLILSDEDLEIIRDWRNSDALIGNMLRSRLGREPEGQRG